MKLTLKAASITGYGGGFTPDGPSLRVVFKCPLNQTIAKALGVRETLYTQNDDRKSWSLNLFESTELKGKITDCEVLLSPNGDDQYDTLLKGGIDVDNFVALNEDGSPNLKFRINTQLNDELMVAYMVNQGKEAADSIRIEARQKELFNPEAETAVVGPEQQVLEGTTSVEAIQ